MDQLVGSDIIYVHLMLDISGRNGDVVSRYSIRVAARAGYFVNILPSRALSSVGSFEILYDLFCPLKTKQSHQEY